jgi:hypothetical protein
MTKYLLLILFPLNVFASGSLSLEPAYDPIRHRTHYGLGLAVFQPIKKSISYSSWTGYGNGIEGESNFHSWAVSKHSVDFVLFKRLTLSPGVRFNYLDDQETGYKKRFFTEANLKLQVKIW